MFLIYWLLRLLLAVGVEKSAPAREMSAAAKPPVVAKQLDFEKDVKPIFEKHCQPCHFEGGKMYARLPFDRPETIVKLNTKLFTRIKDQDEQQIIRAFLASR